MHGAETFTISWSGRGRQYLRWTTPPTSTRFSTSDCSGSGLFCTTLRISNATVNETGQYQCSYRDLKVEDGKTSVAAHVFVHGTAYFILTWLWEEGFENRLEEIDFGQLEKSRSSVYPSRRYSRQTSSQARYTHWCLDQPLRWMLFNGLDCYESNFCKDKVNSVNPTVQLMWIKVKIQNTLCWRGH